MSHCADDTYDVYDETTFRARKRHECDACKRAILPGHYYTRVFVRYDGRAEHVKRCGACQRTHLHLRELCWEAGGMWPDECLGCGLGYEDEWGGEPPPEIQALAFASDDERGQELSPLGRLRDWARGERFNRWPDRCMNCNKRPAMATESAHYQPDLLCWLFTDGRCDARHADGRSR